jgi:FkbM family methyltransferase
MHTLLTFLHKAASSVLGLFGLVVVRERQARRGSELTMDMLLQRLSRRNVPISTIIDIGASDAKWSRTCMRHFPQASFLAVEPLEERRAPLERFRYEHPKFDFELCVAGDRDGEDVVFTVADDLDGSGVGEHPEGEKRRCPVRTIDSLVKERQFSPPFFLKFDTHGFELPILAGCADILQNTSAILMEVYTFQMAPDALRFYEMCAHLNSLGFRPVDMAEPRLRPHDQALWQVDMLFLRSDHETFRHHAYR